MLQKYCISFNLLFENKENGIDHKVSVRALGYIAIGHVILHTNVIKEKYLH